MAGFAMCESKTCTLSRECRRHPDSGTVPDALSQIYADFGGGDNCHYLKPLAFDRTRRGVYGGRGLL